MSEKRRSNWAVRTLVWFAVVLAVVVGLAVLAVQIVLWDGRLPRRLVEEGIAEQTGLRTSVARVTTGWFGETILEDVTLRLPLEDEPLATLPRVRVSHADLLLIILGRPLAIDDAEAEGAVISLREDTDGVWNVERAASLLERAQAGQEPGTGEVSLPGLDIRGAVVEIRRADGRETSVPLSLDAEGDEAGGWNFALLVPDRVSAKGRVAPGGDWRHELEFNIQDIGEVLALWTEEFPSPLRLEGAWRGRSWGDGLAGTARLDELVVGEERASGTVRVRTPGSDGATLALHPLDMELSSPALPGGAVVIREGDVALRDGTVSAADVVAAWAGMAVRLDGSWSTVTQEGRVDAVWSGSVPGMDVEQRGSIRAAARLPRLGLPQIEVELTSTGQGFGGSWDAAVEASATGESLSQLQARLTAPTLRWTDGEGTVDLGGLTARVAGDERVVRLEELTAPGAVVDSARAAVDLETLEWAADVAVRDWEVPRAGAGAIALVVKATGDAASAVVEEARLAVAGIDLTATGRYSAGENDPLRAQLRAVVPSWSPAGESGAEAGEGGAAELATGRWAVEAEITGSVRPLDVQARGTAAGEGVLVGGERLDPINVSWTGGTDEGVAWVRTRAFEVLGGLFELRARYGLGEESEAGGAVSIAIAELPLDRIAALAGAPVEVSGALTADLDVVAPTWDVEQLAVLGQWSVERPTADRYGVDRGRGRIQTSQGRVDFTDILLQLGEGQVTGSVGFNLSRLQQLEVALTSVGWPVQLEGTQIGVLLDAEAELTVDVVEEWARGRIVMDSPLLVRGERYAEIDAAVEVDGRTIEVQLESADVAGGFVSGTAVLPLDEPLSTRADLWWDKVDLANVLRPWADLEALQGQLTGRLTVERAESPRAPEPLRVVFSVVPEGVSWHGTAFGNMVLDAYVGEDRVLLEESLLSIAGGRIAVWGRLTEHNGERFVHAQTTFDDVAIESLLRLADPESTQVEGRMTGRLSFGGYVDEPHRAFGTGTLEIERADLANLPVISQLYGLLSLQFGGRNPTGEGTIELALEENSLIIRRLQYFNQGTEVVGGAKLHNIFEGSQSPISGYAVGRVRPLRDLGLPFMKQADDILAAVQSGAASVRLAGTAGDLEIRPAPLRELGGFLRGLFGE